MIEPGAYTRPAAALRDISTSQPLFLCAVFQLWRSCVRFGGSLCSSPRVLCWLGASASLPHFPLQPSVVPVVLYAPLRIQVRGSLSWCPFFYLSSKLGDLFWRQRNERDKYGDFLPGWWTFVSLSSFFILTTGMLKLLKANGSKSQETCISACLCFLMKVMNIWCIISAPLLIPKLYFKESAVPQYISRLTLYYRRTAFLLVILLLQQRNYLLLFFSLNLTLTGSQILL